MNQLIMLRAQPFNMGMNARVSKKDWPPNLSEKPKYIIVLIMFSWIVVLSFDIEMMASREQNIS